MGLIRIVGATDIDRRKEPYQDIFACRKFVGYSPRGANWHTFISANDV